MLLVKRLVHIQCRLHVARCTHIYIQTPKRTHAHTQLGTWYGAMRCNIYYILIYRSKSNVFFIKKKKLKIEKKKLKNVTINNSPMNSLLLFKFIIDLDDLE